MNDQIISDLNVRAAELNELGLMVHVAHVNVTGPLFLALHSFFEGLYEDLLTKHADLLMERVRALGGAATMAGSTGNLPQLPEVLTDGMAVARVVCDRLRLVIDRLSTTRASVAGSVDPDTFRILDDVIHALNKPVWMLTEIGASSLLPTRKQLEFLR